MVRAVLMNSKSLLIESHFFHENATSSRDFSAKIPDSCALDGQLSGHSRVPLKPCSLQLCAAVLKVQCSVITPNSSAGKEATT